MSRPRAKPASPIASALLRDRYGPSENFNFIAQPADLLHDDGNKLEVIDAAVACGAQLIVLDTLNRLMAGGDENSSQDMGGFIRNVAHIRHQTKAHIAIVHHGTKASNGNSRADTAACPAPMMR